MGSNKLVLGVIFGLLVIGIGSYSTNDVFAALDSKGTEFLIAFQENFSGTRGALQLHISGDIATEANISYPSNNPTFTTTVNVVPGQITTVDLPRTPAVWAPGTPSDNLVKVTSTQEITVYTSNLSRASSDAGLAIPTDTLSFKYIVNMYTSAFSFGQFVVFASNDNTQVTITPSVGLSTGQPANVPFTITLNKGEGFSARTPSTQDLSGSIVTADKPIGLTNGNGCTQVPLGTVACDHIYEHGIPVQGWGTRVLVADLPDRPNGSIYRIYASESNTQLVLDGGNIATLGEGQFHETERLSGGHIFSANNPIFVVQYIVGIGASDATNGDPAMANIVPTEQFLNSYTFNTVGQNQFNRHFVTVVAANSDISTIKFDDVAIGASNFSPIGTSGFSYAVIDFINQGTHTTSSTNGHGILVGGYNQADSYLYPGGAAFEFINPQPEDDRDGDGVLDINDECPDEFAETENGCPIECIVPETLSTFFDFNSGAPAELSGFTSTEPVQGFVDYGFDGDFLRNDSLLQSPTARNSTITLTNLPEHTAVNIEFLLAIIDSWDSDDGNCCSPDIFNVSVDGVLVFNNTANHALGTHDYSDVNPSAVIISKEHVGFNHNWVDSAYNMTAEPKLQGIPHTNDTLTIDFYASGEGWQGGIDESWAIDNLKITLDTELPICEIQPPKDDNNSGDNQWDTRPTFGISHEDRGTQVVDSGFSFNGEFFTLTDNHHTDFAEQSVEIGTTNSFSAKVYADKKLKIQEFLFGIPEVGKAELAELGVEVWYDRDGNIEDVKVVQKSDVIDASTLSVIHEKSKCLSTDSQPLCDTTTVSMTFLEPLADKVMAIKAIDYALRDQRTFLNEGFDISGESLNPMSSKMIPSNVRDKGLLKVTQLAKYSPYWQSDDGRMFEMNSFGSFKEINQSFKRHADAGDAKTRLHSGFGGIIQYEQNRALNIFDASQYKSELPESFAYIYPESGERITDDLLQEMLLQEEIAKGILAEMDKQNRYN